MRRTKIVCTIGPVTSSEERLEQLIRAGMNVARLNFSHGKQEEHGLVIERIRAISTRLNIPVAILQDLQGPKIRVGSLQDGQPVQLVDGAHLTITTRDILGTAQVVSTTYKSLPQDVKVGDRILLDDGLLELRVIDFNETDVECVVVHGGPLKEHKGINLPGVAVSSPSLTEKDRDDMRFGVAHDVDYMALSFVRTPRDVLDARAYLQQLQDEFDDKKHRPIPLIAKIEKPEAVEHLDAILAVVDGAMVARGDLGVEMALEKVPLIQKRIIAKCNTLGLPVITATQMLESMITNPRPTRAEVNDVANAVIDQTDAVMLSAETSVGAYPIEAVEVMVRIAQETESGVSQRPPREHLSKPQAVSNAAHALAEEISVKAIVVFTRSGLSAQLISKDRPRTPIFVYTPSLHIYRRLPLWWGVWSYLVSMRGTTEELIAEVEKRLLDDQLVQRGDHVVLMGGMPVGGEAHTNFVKLHRVGDGA